VIATKTGGIPLQVQDGKNGFRMEPRDWKAVRKKFLDLWTDKELYDKVSEFAARV